MELREYQKDGVNFLLSKKKALLASDPGLGKTAQSIVAVNELGNGCYLRVLVLCPKSVILNWKNEIKMWSKSSTVDWTVINWDKLITKELQKLSETKWDIVIGDEFHKALKSWKAKRCQNFIKYIAPNVERLWLLSATPASKSAEDYHPMLTLLDPETPKHKDFCDTYCHKNLNPWSRQYEYSGFKNTAPLKEVFKRIALKHRKKDVAAQLPRKQYAKVYVDVNREIISECLELDQNLIEYCIKEGKQIPGHIASVIRAIGMSKIEAAVEWINNFPENEPLVIVGWHKDVIQQIYDGIDDKGETGIITGETPAKLRQIFVEQFQSGVSNRIIINYQAGGVGINLHRASNMLEVEFPWSPTDLIQARGRIHRIGSVSDSVTYWQMIANNTVDDLILESLYTKQKGIKEVGI